MNLETAVIQTIQGLGILKTRKEHPFPQGCSNRDKEEVRPIFWANKPASYIEKTATWDEFPNGRWGDSRSPAFITNEKDDGFVSYSKKFKTTNVVEKKKNWGKTCRTVSDISSVFVAYLSGKMKKFPFSEGVLALETDDISQVLLQMN